MIEFGSTLRKAREERGLTQQDLAVRTNLMVQQIDELEREDFSRIAAPIYGRGFVRLYCEAVGLDPNIMIAEFMEILNGNREPVIRMRPTPPPAPDNTPEESTSEAEAAAEAAADTLQPPTSGNDFRLESEAIPPTSPEPEPAFILNGPSAYHTRQPIDPEYPNRPSRRFSLQIPPVVWRVGILCAGAALILYLLFAAFRGLYRLTMGGSAAESAPAGETQPSAAPDGAGSVPADDGSGRPAGQRALTTLPPLYID